MSIHAVEQVEETADELALRIREAQGRDGKPESADAVAAVIMEELGLKGVGRQVLTPWITQCVYTALRTHDRKAAQDRKIRAKSAEIATVDRNQMPERAVRKLNDGRPVSPSLRTDAKAAYQNGMATVTPARPSGVPATRPPQPSRAQPSPRTVLDLLDTFVLEAGKAFADMTVEEHERRFGVQVQRQQAIGMSIKSHRWAVETLSHHGKQTLRDLPEELLHSVVPRWLRP
jgi:hypothetical protein